MPSWSEVKVTQSCLTFCKPIDYTVHGILQARILECLSLLQGVFPTQRSNLGLPRCRRILYQLSHKGSPRTLEWVAYPFSSGSSWPRYQTGVSYIVGGFFTNWAIKEALSSVQFSCSVVSDSLRPHESQHNRPPCPSPTPGVHSDSHPSSQWCHPISLILSPPSPPAPNPSQHQSLLQWVNSSHQVAKVLEFQL